MNDGKRKRKVRRRFEISKLRRTENKLLRHLSYICRYKNMTDNHVNTKLEKIVKRLTELGVEPHPDAIQAIKDFIIKYVMNT